VGVTWELVGLAMAMSEAGGGEMEYDGRVLAGIGVRRAGKEGGMGRSEQIYRGWWETGGLDVV
jgi:hypothetical protein